MTGGFGFAPTSHERAVLELDDGSRLVYRDVRRFGTWLVLEDGDLDPYLAEERPGAARVALHLHVARRAARPAARAAQGGSPRPARRRGSREHLRRRGPLARAREPATAGERAHARRGRPCAPCDPCCLRAGIARQGSTLRDYATPDGAAGSMQDEFRVYGRDGQPCSRCRTPIAKARVGGRGTWFCPRCQP